MYYFTPAQESGFIALSATLAVCVNLYLWLVVGFRVLRYHSAPAEGTWTDSGVSLGALCLTRLWLFFVTILAAYMVALFFRPEHFAPYKGISPGLLTPFSVAHIVLTVVYLITMVECLGVTAIYRLLFQEGSMSIWCTQSVKYKCLGPTIGVAILCVYVLDFDDSHMEYGSVVVALLAGERIVLSFREAIPYFPAYELSELGWDCCVVCFEVLIFLTKGLGLCPIADAYSYALVAPVAAGILCTIRVLLVPGVNETHEVHSEESELDGLRAVLSLFHDKGRFSQIHSG